MEVYCDNGCWFVREGIIPFLDRDDIDLSRYQWCKAKLLAKAIWKEARSYKYDGYDFQRIDFLISNEDLLIRFTPRKYLQTKYKQHKLYLRIKNFRELSAQEVLNALCGYDRAERIIPGGMYPLGMHFEEGLLDVWMSEGLPLNRMKQQKGEQK